MLEHICVANMDCRGLPAAVSAVVPAPSVSTDCPLGMLYTICCSKVPFPVILPEMSMGVGAGLGSGVYTGVGADVGLGVPVTMGVGVAGGITNPEPPPPPIGGRVGAVGVGVGVGVAVRVVVGAAVALGVGVGVGADMKLAVTTLSEFTVTVVAGEAASATGPPVHPAKFHPGFAEAAICTSVPQL